MNFDLLTRNGTFFDGTGAVVKLDREHKLDPFCRPRAIRVACARCRTVWGLSARDAPTGH
jgi:hypothetical protein